MHCVNEDTAYLASVKGFGDNALEYIWMQYKILH